MRYLLLSLTVLPALSTDAQLAERWTIDYNGPGNYHDGGSAISVTPEGNVVVTGNSAQYGGGMDSYTAMYGAVDGRLMWERKRMGPARDTGIAVAVTKQGDVFVAGGSDGRLFTARYRGTDGAVLWENASGGRPGATVVANAIAVDLQGDLVVAGRDNLEGNYHCYVAKYRAHDGLLLWETNYRSGSWGWEDPSAVEVDAEGNVFVTGAVWFGSSYSNEDSFLLKLSGSTGAILWNVPEEEGCEDELEYRITSLAVDSAGNPVIAGYYHPNDETPRNGIIIKLDRITACTLWKKVFDAHLHGNDDISDIAVDDQDNVTVTGSSQYSGSGAGGFYTGKYAGTDGRVLWERVWAGPDRTDQYSYSIAVDNPGGRVAVAGHDQGGVRIIQYRLADGSDLGTVRYEGGWRTWLPRDTLAILPDGGVAITGTNHGGEIGIDLRTVCYGPPGTAFNAWRRQYFGAPGRTGPAADSADPDGDGMTNLLEWALGTPPTIPGGQPVNAGQTGQALTFEYPMSLAAASAGTVFQLEWTDRLAAGWQTADSASVQQFKTGGTRLVRAALPSGPVSKFVRLKVTAP